MSKKLRILLESYSEYLTYAGGANALGDSNRLVVEAVMYDVNILLSYGIWNIDEIQLSAAVEMMVGNVSINNEELNDDRINDINYAAGMLATDVLGGMFLIDDFYRYQIEVEDSSFYDIHNDADSASIRIEAVDTFQIDETRAPDPSRLIAGFHSLFRCKGEHARNLRCEIRSIVDGLRR